MAKNGHWWVHVWIRGHWAGADDRDKKLTKELGTKEK